MWSANVRRKTAQGLPRLVKAVTFQPDGRWSVSLVDSLPLSLRMSGASISVRIAHRMQHDPAEAAKAFSRRGDKVVLDLTKLRFQHPSRDP